MKRISYIIITLCFLTLNVKSAMGITVSLNYSGLSLEATTPTLGGAGDYASGTDVVIYAQDRVKVNGLAALTKEYFVQWSDGSTENPRTLSSISANVNLKAEYRAFAKHTAILDTINKGETFTFDNASDKFDDANFGDNDVRRHFAVYNGNKLTKATSYTEMVTYAQDPTTLVDTLYTWTLRVFTPGEYIVYYVDDENGSDSNNGKSWAKAVKTIAKGVTLANSAHTTNGQQNQVWVKEGTYTAATGEYVFRMYNYVSIYGGFAGTEEDLSDRTMSSGDPWDFEHVTIIDGKNTRRCVDYYSVAGNNLAILEGVTLQNGLTEKTSKGAGVSLRGNSQLLNCVVSNNVSETTMAAGVYSIGVIVAGERLSPTIDGCYIHDNTLTSSTAAVMGAGVYSANYGLTINASKVEHNVLESEYTTANGAGVYVAAGGITLQGGTEISKNVAKAETAANGAGMYVKAGIVDISDTRFYGDTIRATTTAYGAGMYLATGGGSILSSTFEGNESNAGTIAYGGGAYIKEAPPTIESVEFKANVLNPATGAAAGAGVYVSTGPVTLNDVTFGGETPADGNVINGVTAANGAGLYVYAAGATLNDVIAKNNRSTASTTGSGAGAYIKGGAIVNGGRFNSNSITSSSAPTDPLTTAVKVVGYGAGLYVSGNADIDGAVFADNSMSVTADASLTTNAAATASATAYGAGLYLTGGVYNLDNVEVSRNTLSSSAAVVSSASCKAPAYGAGAYISGGLTADGCVFSENEITNGITIYGVGLYSLTAATSSATKTQTFSECSFVDNTISLAEKAIYGVGGYISAGQAGASITIDDAVVSGNTASVKTLYGGGLALNAVAGASNTVNRGRFFDNQFGSTSGSLFGIALYGAKAVPDVVHVYNSLFYNNTSNKSTGNYTIYTGAGNIVNNTLYNNAGGMYLYSGTASSLVANNIVKMTKGGKWLTGKELTGLPVHHNYMTGTLPTAELFDITGDNHVISQSDAKNFMSVDPSSEEFLHLRGASEFIDQGYDASSITEMGNDFNGESRPASFGGAGVYDIGAFEYNGMLVEIGVDASTPWGKAVLADGLSCDPRDPEETSTAVNDGEDVYFVAIPNYGYEFVEWSNGLTDACSSITVEGDTSVEAIFDTIVSVVKIGTKALPASGSYRYDIVRAGSSTVLSTLLFEEVGNYEVFTSGDDVSAFPKTQKLSYVATALEAKNGSTDSLVTVLLMVYPEYEIEEDKRYTCSGTYNWEGHTSGDKGSVEHNIYIDDVSATSIDVSSGREGDEFEIEDRMKTIAGFDSIHTFTLEIDGVGNHTSEWAEVEIYGAAYGFTGVHPKTGVTWSDAYFGLKAGKEYEWEHTLENATDGGCDSVSRVRVTVKRYESFKHEEDPEAGYLQVTDWTRSNFTVMLGNQALTAATNARLYVNNLNTISTSVPNDDQTMTAAYPYNTGDSICLMLRDVSKTSGSYAHGDTLTVQYVRIPYILKDDGLSSTLTSNDEIYVVDNSTGTIIANATVRKVTIGSGAKLVVSAGYTLKTDTLIIKSKNDANGSLELGTGASIKPNANSKVRVVYSKRVTDKSRNWLMSLPYNCSFADIGTTLHPTTVPKQKQMLFKYYDSEGRAGLDQSKAVVAGVVQYDYVNAETWKEVESNRESPTTTVNAHHGYEIGTNTKYYREYLFPTEVDVIAPSATPVELALDSFINRNAWNNHWGWNFVGLPTFAAKAEGVKVPYQKKCFDGTLGTLVEDLKVTMQASDGTWSEQVEAAEVEILPFSAFFVQVDSGGSASFGTMPVASAPLRTRDTGSMATMRVRLSLADAILPMETIIDENGDEVEVEGAPLADKTTIDINDKFTAGYDLMYDLEKNMSADARPQVYTIAAKGNMVFNAIPEAQAAQMIPVGAIFRHDGEHILSLKGEPSSGIEAVYLYDAETQQTTDLMQSEYSFEAEEGMCNSRFSLQLRISQRADVTTENEIIEAKDGIGVRTAEGGIMLTGLHGMTDIRVYDATGRIVATAKASAETTISLPQSGVYMLTINGKDTTESIKIIYKR